MRFNAYNAVKRVVRPEPAGLPESSALSLGFLSKRVRISSQPKPVAGAAVRAGLESVAESRSQSSRTQAVRAARTMGQAIHQASRCGFLAMNWRKEAGR